NDKGGSSEPPFPSSRRFDLSGCPLQVAAMLFRRGVDAHAAQLFRVVLPVEYVPLFAAFDNLLFLGSDLLANFGVGFFFFTQRVRQQCNDLLANGVAILN